VAGFRVFLQKRLAGFGPRGLVYAVALLYALLFAFLAIYKHEIYTSSRFDLGNMDQAVWNSAHGRILETTDTDGNLISRLQNHADFLLLAFMPLYWLWATPYWLLVIQSAVVGLGAVPLYWLCQRFLNREWPAALIPVAYLLNPGLQAANLFDFHAQMMAGTFLLFAFHYLLERRPWPFVAFAVLAASTKEEISLIVAMMGLYALFFLKRPRWGVPISIAGTLYFLLVMLVVIPAFNIGDASRLVEGRYELFGGSITGVLGTAISDPLFTLSFIFSGERPLYLLSLLGMSGFLGVLAPFVLAIPLPELAINLLSDRPQMVSIRYQYVAPILPFTYLAAAAGLANLLRWLEKLREGRWKRRLLAKAPVVFAVGLLLAAVNLDYELGPLPLFNSPTNFSSVIDPLPRQHIEALDEAVARIPEGASVSASNNLGAHLAHRRYLYLFPTLRDAEYVIVDGGDPSYDTKTSPVLNMGSIQRLKESGEYELTYSRDGVVVFRRR